MNGHRHAGVRRLLAAVALLAAPLTFTIASTTSPFAPAAAESALCATPQPHEANGSLEQPTVGTGQLGVFTGSLVLPWSAEPNDSVAVARGPYSGVVAYDGVQFGLVDAANGLGITVAGIGAGQPVVVSLAAKAIGAPAALEVEARHTGDTVELGAPTVAVNGPDRGGWTVLTFTDTNTSSDPATYFITAPAASSAVAIDDVQVRSVAAACNDLVGLDSGGEIDVPVLSNDEGARLTVTAVGSPIPAGGVGVTRFDDHLHIESVAGQTGTFAVPYTITDGAGNLSDAAVTVVVRPLAVDDEATVAVDSGSIGIDVLANDLGPAKSIVLVADPLHGVASIVGDHLEYTPDPSFVGLDTFDYTMSSNGFEVTATVTVRVSPRAGLSVDAGNPAPSVPIAGATFTLPFTVSNAGPSAALAPVLTLLVPAGVTFVTGDSCVPGPPVQCGFPAATALRSGGEATFRPVFRATSSGPITIGAAVSSSTTDPDPADDSATADVDVAPTADVLVANTAVTTAPVTPGSPITWTVDVANAGPSVATSTVAVFGFPGAEVTSVTATVSGGSPVVCTTSSDSVVCPFGDMVSGTFREVTLTGDVAGGATLDDLVFSSTVASAVADIVPTNNDQVISAGALPQADLTVAASLQSSSPLSPGGAAEYSIVTTNQGPDRAQGVTLVVAVPTGLSVETPPTGCAASASLLACRLGPIDPGATRTVDVSASIASSPPPGDLVLTATVTAATPDPSPANAIATVVSPVARQADVGVHLAVVPNPPTVGDNAVLFAVVTNSGPSTATNVVTTINVPTGFTVLGLGPACTGGAPVTCTLPSLPADAVRPIAIIGEWPVAPGVPQVFTAATTASEPDPVSSDDTDTLDVAPIVSADLSVSGTIGQLPVGANQANSYTLTVENGGGADVGAGSTVEIQVSPGITVGTLPAGCSQVATVVTCILGPLGVGDQTVLVIPFTTGGAVPIPLVAIATVQVPAGVTDPDPTNDQAEISDAQARAADIALNELFPVAFAISGGNTVAFFTIANLGPSDVSDSKFAVFLAQDYAFVSAAGASCFPTSFEGVVQCSTGPLASGEQKVVAITVTTSVAPLPPPDFQLGDAVPGITEEPTGPIDGPITNLPQDAVLAIAFDSAIDDFNLTNNVGVVAVERLEPVDLVLTGSAPATVTVGSPATFTFQMTNAGTAVSPVNSVLIRPPSGVTLDSSTGSACTSEPFGVSCPVGTILPGASSSPITVTFGTTGLTDPTFELTARATTFAFELNAADNELSFSVPLA